MAPEAVVNYVALPGWSPKDGNLKLGIDDAGYRPAASDQPFRPSIRRSLCMS